MNNTKNKNKLIQGPGSEFLYKKIQYEIKKIVYLGVFKSIWEKNEKRYKHAVLFKRRTNIMTSYASINKPIQHQEYIKK